MSHEIGTLMPMPISEAFRQQDFDILPHQFVPPMTKYLFGLSIYPNDLAVLIDYDHGIGCSLQEAAKSFRLVFNRSLF